MKFGLSSIFDTRPPPSLAPQTETDVDHLYNQANVGSSTLNTLKYMDWLGSKFDSIQALITAVAKSQHDRQNVLNFLTSPDQRGRNLFKKHLGDPADFIRMAEVERIFKESKAGPHILRHMQELLSKKAQFGGLEDLISGIMNVHVVSSALRGEVLVYILSHSNNFDLKERPTAESVDQLFAETGAERYMMHHLERLVAKNVFVHSQKELIDLVNKGHKKLLKNKQDVWKHLVHEKCDLLLEKKKLKVADVEPIILQIHNPNYLLQLGLNQRFESVDALLAALQNLMREKARVHAFLRSHDGFIKDRSWWPDSRKVDTLFLKALSGASTTMYLFELQLQKKRFKVYDDLITCVTDMHKKSLEDRKRVLDYLKRHPMLVGNANITNHQVDNLFNIAQAGASTKYHLKNFTKKGREYSSIDELIEVVKEVHRSFREDFSRVLVYLTNTQPRESNLFAYATTPVKITSQDVLHLYESTGAGPALLKYLRALDQQMVRVESVVELIDKVLEAQRQRKRVMDYLNNTSKLLRRSNINVTDALNDRLHDSTNAGPNMLGYLKQLDRSKKQFGSMDALINAIRAMINWRKSVLEFLKGPRNEVFEGTLKMFGQSRSKFVEALFEKTGAGSSLLSYLHVICDEPDANFTSIESLAKVIRDMHTKSQSERQGALEFLQSAENLLFSNSLAEIAINTETVDELVDEAKAGMYSVMLLRDLSVSGVQVEDMKELAMLLKNTYKALRKMAGKCLEYMNDSTVNQLLQGTEAEGRLTMKDVHRLITESGACSRLMDRLETLERNGDTFDSVDELIDAIKTIESDRVKALKLLVDTSTPYHLLQRSSADNISLATLAKNVERLFSSCWSSSSACKHLQQLQKARRQFIAFKDLLEAVEAMDASYVHQDDQDAAGAVAAEAQVDEGPLDPSAGDSTTSSMILVEGETENVVNFDAEIRQVHAYLADRTKNSLLRDGPDDIPVTQNDVKLMFESIYPEEPILPILEGFNEKEMVFVNCKELTGAVSDVLARKRILGFLNDAGFSLLNRQVSQREVDMIVDGAGASAMSIYNYLVDFNRLAKRFSSKVLDHLITSLKGVDRRAQMKRKQVHQYLKSKMNFFVKNSTPSLVKTIGDMDDMNRLFEVCGTENSTLSYVKFLENIGRRFERLQDLVAPLRSLHKNSLQTRDEVLIFLLFQSSLFEPELDKLEPEHVDNLFQQSGCHLDIMSVLRKVAGSGKKFPNFPTFSSAMAEALTNNNIHKASVLKYLLSSAGANMLPSRSRLNIKQVEELFSAAESGELTLAHLKHLNHSHQSFDSISALASAIIEIDREQCTGYERQVLIYLTSEPVKHTLFEKPFDVTLGLLQKTIHLPSSCDLDRFTPILKEINAQGRKFSNLTDLVQAVCLEFDNNFAMKHTIFEWLGNPKKCALFGHQFEITMDLADEMYHLAADESISVLRELEARGAKFRSAKSLLRAFREQAQYEISRDVFSYLSDSSNHTLLPKDVKISHALVEDLFKRGNAARSTLSHLQQLDREGRYFHNFESMLQAVANSVAQRQRVQHELNNPNVFTFFDHLPTPVTVSYHQVVRLFEQAETGDSTLDNLKFLQKQGRKFRTVDELIEALKDMKLDRKRVLIYLLDFEQRKLLVKPPTNSQVNELLERIRTDPATFGYLKKLKRLGFSFATLKELGACLQTMHRNGSDAEQAYKYLTYPARSKLLGRDFMINKAIIDRVVGKGEAGPATIILLMHLERAGRVFNNPQDLVNALREQEAAAVKHQEEVLEYLKDESLSSLVEERSDLQKNLNLSFMDELFLRCGSHIYTKSQLIELDRRELVFNKTEDLIEAIASEYKAEMTNRDQVLDFLTRHVVSFIARPCAFPFSFTMFAGPPVFNHPHVGIIISFSLLSRSPRAVPCLLI